MRILKVAFKNINSLSGEHEIDFTKEPFTYSSLFVISGATGSGKSSILDVISLALYNTIPRMGKVSTRDVANIGAVLTRGQEKAYAKVTYASKQGVFRSEWSISTARTGNLREYEMSLYDLKSNKKMDFNKGMVPKANEEQIGLSYEQFNKSVMLAQGEFAEFLKAPKKVRGDLLEKITGAAIYRRIGIAVFQKFREHENKTKDLKVILESKQKELKPIAEIKAKKTEEENLKSQLKELDAQVEVLKEQNRQIIEILKKQAELTQTQKLYKTSKEAYKQFMLQDGKSWQEHKKLLPYLSDIQTWEQINENLEKLQEQKIKLQKDKQALETESKQLCARISGIIKSEVTEENALASLETFYEKYEHLEKQITKLRNEYSEERATANALLRNLGTEFTFNPNSASFARDLEDSKKEVQNTYEQLLSKIGIEANNLTEASVDKLNEELRSLRQAQLLANDIRNSYTKTKEASALLIKSKEKLTQLLGQQELLDTQAELTLTKFEKITIEKQNALLSQSLEKHRAELKDGEACPLCGSLEHPFAVHSPTPSSDLDNALKNAKQALDKARETQLTNKNEAQNLSKQIANDEQINTKSIAHLEQLNKNFQTQYHKITETPITYSFTESIGLQEERLKKLQNALIAKKQLQTFTELLPVAEKMHILSQNGKELKVEIDKLYADENFKEVYQNTRETFQKNRYTWQLKLDVEKTLLADFETTQSNLKKATDSLENSLSQIGIESIEKALKVRLKDSVYLAFENQHASIQQAIQKAETQQDLQQKDLAKLSKNISLENKEEIRKDLDKKLEELEKLKQQEKELSFFLKNQSDLQKDIQEKQEQIDVLSINAKPWELLNKMIGDAQGRKFNDYAQDMTLTHLLYLANKRLDGLNKRYKIDKPIEENEGDKLMVIDQDMGNQRRAISTLSGGETFMASLALALALSDLAAKNVQIESMFIDEGFGTLDAESLDQTLDALERLQLESSKLIGIISHVDSIKERVSTQIQLVQDGKGYSKMEVVG